MQQGIGIDTELVGPTEVARLVPGVVTDDFGVAVYEPRSGYADPSGHGGRVPRRGPGARRAGRPGLPGDARPRRGRPRGRRRDRARPVRCPGRRGRRRRLGAPLARTVGVDVPVETWRHDTAYFGLPDGRAADFPIVIDEINEVYFRPEGARLMLVGLEAGNEVGGSPDRPLARPRRTVVEDMVRRVCARVPWMADGTLRTGHGGQDGITPDQRPSSARPGRTGFYLACGFSGTGFKTAPAVGRCLTELILDGAGDDGGHHGLLGSSGSRRAGRSWASTRIGSSGTDGRGPAVRLARRARTRESSFAREDDFGVVLILILLTILSFAAATARSDSSSASRSAAGPCCSCSTRRGA